VLGSGFEASMHVRAFAAVRELSEVTVFSPTPERRAAFATAMAEELGVPRVAAQSAEVAGNLFRDSCDVVLCAARSRGEKPILFGDDLGPEVTVVSIGSTVPHQREIDATVVERCELIVCDDLGEVVDETGDMIAAAEGGVSLDGKCVSLHALMSGEADDRRDRAAVRMFKSVGSGVQDIVIAGLALERAIQAGQATSLPVAFAT